MKTVIIYYTFGGATKKEAQRLKTELNATLYRVKEVHNRSLLGSFIPGGFQAMKRKSSKINPININFNHFDRIIIGAPIWAGFPAPAFNAIVEQIPAGKEVELFFCSGGGEAPKSEQGTKDMIEAKGCKLISYRDIKTLEKPSKMKE